MELLELTGSSAMHESSSLHPWEFLLNSHGHTCRVPWWVLLCSMSPSWSPCLAGSQLSQELYLTTPGIYISIRPLSFANSLESVCLSASHSAAEPIILSLQQQFFSTSESSPGSSGLPGQVSRNAVLSISCSANRGHHMFRGKIGFAL